MGALLKFVPLASGRLLYPRPRRSREEPARHSPIPRQAIPRIPLPNHRRRFPVAQTLLFTLRTEGPVRPHHPARVSNAHRPHNPQKDPPPKSPLPTSPPLYDYVQHCRACQLQLTAAKQNATDDAAKIRALTRERDAAVTAAKGGSFWLRLKRNAHWLAIGAAVGAVTSTAVLCNTGHSRK